MLGDFRRIKHFERKVKGSKILLVKIAFEFMILMVSIDLQINSKKKGLSVDERVLKKKCKNKNTAAVQLLLLTQKTGFG
jgi:hypothetical protein